MRLVGGFERDVMRYARNRSLVKRDRGTLTVVVESIRRHLWCPPVPTMPPHCPGHDCFSRVSDVHTRLRRIYTRKMVPGTLQTLLPPWVRLRKTLPEIFKPPHKGPSLHACGVVLVYAVAAIPSACHSPDHRQHQGWGPRRTRAPRRVRVQGLALRRPGIP